MKATEVFGPFGIGWGTADDKYEVVDLDDVTKLIIYTGVLWYLMDGVKGSFTITSGIKLMYKARSGMFYDDDATKKVQTNAISKGLSRLGFSADIFLGKFDDAKYVADARAVAESERGLDTVQLKTLKSLIEQADPDMEKMLENYGIDMIEALPASRYDNCVGLLRTKIAAKEKKAGAK